MITIINNMAISFQITNEKISWKKCGTNNNSY